MPFPILEGYNSICTMRSSVVQDYLQFLLQKEKGERRKFLSVFMSSQRRSSKAIFRIIHLTDSHSCFYTLLLDLDIQYGELDLDPEVEKVKVVTQCFASIEASSNTADIYKMTNGETSSFWQSDGSARSHWIRYGHPFSRIRALQLILTQLLTLQLWNTFAKIYN